VQCHKRKIVCPGYEKKLKWSTKYEVLFKLSGTDLEADTADVGDIILSPEIVSGFEALAAALPSGKKTPDERQKCFSVPTAQEQVEASPESQPETVESHTLPTGNFFKEDESSQETDPSPIDITDLIDPALLEGFSDGLDDFQVPYSFDQDISFDQDTFDFLEQCAFENPIADIEEVLRPPDNPSCTELSKTHSPRSLLLDYYGLPSPSPAASLTDIESFLVQHYFKDVCVLFSSFDSILNPFRTTIGRIFQNSSSIYYAIQSMAAAHLANTYPPMAAVGIELQRKACESLREELPLVQAGQTNNTTSFLSIILLGLTTTWHESGALGVDFLTVARSLILPKLLSSSDREDVQRETQFFEDSLIYWEMLMGFVTQDGMEFPSRSGLRNRTIARPIPDARKRDGKIMPHPWSCAAPTIQILFAEVGRLVRKERLLHMSGTIDMRGREDNLLNASMLEEDLLATECPLAEELADPGDAKTAKRDFVVMAEAYRCAGLLEIYRVFPSILRKRLGTNAFWTDKIDLGIPVPRFETAYEDTDTKLWTNSLALHILSTLETLPSSSGTCCLQPILFVVAASELKFVSSIDFFDIHANDTKVLQARAFASRRLDEFARRFAAKPIRKAIEIVGETWRRLDGGEEIFWIDVMEERGWNTVMG
jgi:hypothetical protein